MLFQILYDYLFLLWSRVSASVNINFNCMTKKSFSFFFSKKAELIQLY